MRHITLLTITAALACSAPGVARAQIPQQLLQSLLPGAQGGGGQNAEQAVREAYERGYRQGRQDQDQADRSRMGNNRQQPRGGYPDQDQGNGYQRGPYNR